MIFLGDIAAPDKATSESLAFLLSRHCKIFDNKRLICNFEGLISDREPLNDTRPILFNHSSVPGTLNRGIAPVLCLANNHILDLPDNFDLTIRLINSEGAQYCGAGRSAKEASDHLTFFENGRKAVLINACWDFLLYNHKNPSAGVYVEEMDENRLISTISTLRQIDLDTSIITYLHWNLDLETLPFPMYGRLARALIDAGADLIIGSHSHCVQGGEKYRDKYILYGLGNFFMPGGIFAGGKIRYPEFARTELVFEWDPVQNNGICHWFESQDSQSGHDLLYKRSERFEDSVILKQYSPYQNMSDKDYLQYFRANRRKRFLIPIYKNHKSRIKNRLKTLFLKNRARFAYLLARLNLIKWQN